VLAQMPDGVVGVDAIRATAVGDDRAVGGQLAQPPPQLGDRE
jgi:hypothetical protein